MWSPYSLAGLTAGEGCFSSRRIGQRRDGSERIRFVFTMKLALRDRPALEALRASLGCGSITDRAAIRPHHQPLSALTVNSRTQHRELTIPWFDRYLTVGHKRTQFDEWRDRFDAYELAHPNPFGRGRSVCSETGCDGPVRGRGLCRSHYHRATGY